MPDDEGADQLESSLGIGDELRVGGLEAKRVRFKKLARDDPGRLLVTGLEQLRNYTDPGVGGTGDPLEPVVLKYLMGVYVPNNPVAKLGEDNFRELRTLAESIDGLLRGQTTPVLDLLMQRFKAKTMALRDGTWAAARWLELLPADSAPSAVSLSELETVRSLQAGELKLAELALCL